MDAARIITQPEVTSTAEASAPGATLNWMDDEVMQHLSQSIQQITSVELEPDQRLAAAGISSISIIYLVETLQRRFPEAAVDTLFLLQNPTLREIAERVQSSSRPGAARDNASRHMSLHAVQSLRGLLCLWIMRSHFGICTWRELSGQKDGEDTWLDGDHTWRVSLFFVLAGMHEAIKSDQVHIPSLRRVCDFVLPLLPIVWLAMLFASPLHGGIANLLSNPQNPWVVIIFVSNAFLIPFSYKTIPVESVIGPGWFLAALVFSLLLFNVMHAYSKSAFFGGTNAVYEGVRPSPPHQRRLAFFVLRIAIACVPCVVFEAYKASTRDYFTFVPLPQTWVWGWHPDPNLDTFNYRFGLLHMSPLARLLTFYPGLVVGQGCVDVSLSIRQARCAGAAADLSIVTLLVLAFTSPADGSQWSSRDELLKILHMPILCIFIFGVCRASRNSITAYVLSWGPLRELARFTLAIYLFHQPLLNWLQFVRSYRVQGFFPWEPGQHFLSNWNRGKNLWGQAARPLVEWIDPREGPTLSSWNLSDTDGHIDHERITRGCYTLPFEAITLTCTTLIVAIIATVVVYEPAQRLYYILMLEGSRALVPVALSDWVCRTRCSWARIRVRPGRVQSGRDAVQSCVYVEWTLSKRLPDQLPKELSARGVSSEQWVRWIAQLEGATEDSARLHHVAQRCWGPLATSVVQCVSERWGPRRAERVRHGMVVCAAAVEAICFRWPILLPCSGLFFCLHPLYISHWCNLRTAVSCIRDELKPLGWHIHHRPGLVTLVFREDGTRRSLKHNGDIQEEDEERGRQAV